MLAWLNSLPDTQALAVSLVGPGVLLIGGAFIIHEGACFVRLALTGRL